MQKIERNQFTLIEVFTVISIMLIILSIGVGVYTSIVASKKEDEVSAQIAVLEFLIEDFYDNKGFYPNQLEDVSSPFSLANYLNSTDNNRGRKNYKKYLPLIENSDPYGNSYQYVPFSRDSTITNKGAFDLWSDGPDGINRHHSAGNNYSTDTSIEVDDIGNF